MMKKFVSITSTAKVPVTCYRELLGLPADVSITSTAKVPVTYYRLCRLCVSITSTAKVPVTIRGHLQRVERRFP